MIDLEEFVVTAEFGEIAGQVDYTAVHDMFGDPDMVQRKRKNRMIKYGDIELWFWSGKLTAIAFSLYPETPVDGGSIAVTGFWPASRRTMEAVSELLRSRSISWVIDPRMSDLNPEESSQTWVTTEHVHLGFFQGVLQGATADFERLFMPH